MIVLFVFGVVSLIASSMRPQPQQAPPPPQPWQVEISADKAQHDGQFAVDHNQYEPRGLRGGASLTFTGINPPSAGTYTLEIAGVGYSGAPGGHDTTYRLDVIVNSAIQIKPTVTATSDQSVWNNTPLSTDVRLQAGDNTIQLKVEGNDGCSDFTDQCSYVLISGITLIQKGS